MVKVGPGVNKRILSYFVEKRSIVLQLAVEFQVTLVTTHFGTQGDAPAVMSTTIVDNSTDTIRYTNPE